FLKINPSFIFIACFLLSLVSFPDTPPLLRFYPFYIPVDKTALPAKTVPSTLRSHSSLFPPSALTLVEIGAAALLSHSSALFFFLFLLLKNFRHSTELPH